ncbi:cystathionine beta-lyase [Spiribacter salinus]|uniref:cystathionine beta-lyase n=1 Tax=Spiribacter salinus TaxID=1335746 RepID=UPI001C9DAB87|nr:cystathionine beta-lyase [Spiribacter salinus]
MKRDTRLVHGGRPGYSDGRRPVNPPLVRASTVDFSSVAEMKEAQRLGASGEQAFTYGIHGTPTTFALESLITELEGGAGTCLYSSGLEAISAVFLGFLRPGDHLLVVDTVYSPVRRLLDRFLAERDIQYDFYSPREADLGRLIRKETRMIYTETPGSVSMELQDIDAIAQLARQHGEMIVACDNTWASGYCFRPLEHGADLSIVAGTKYLSGHSDVMIGSVTATEQRYSTLHSTHELLGFSASPDDCALTLRGARTLHIRYPAHAERALQVAQWLEGHDAVVAVHYPALPSSPDHPLWLSQYEGAAGLFTMELYDVDTQRVTSFLDQLKLFGRGASWGGFESLALPCPIAESRCVDDWEKRGALVRLHIGLEDPLDLINDLAQALAAAGCRTR